MARIPTPDRTHSTIDTGSNFFRSRNGATAAGRAMEGVGEQISRLGAVLEERNQTADAITAEKALIDWEARSAQTILQSERDMPADGRGYHQKTIDRIYEDANKTLETIPEGVRDRAGVRLSDKVMNYANQTASSEMAKRRAHTKEVTDQKVAQLQGAVGAGLYSLDYAVQEAGDFIGGLDLGDGVKGTLQAQLTRELELTDLKRKAAIDPQKTYAELSMLIPGEVSSSAPVVHGTIARAARSYNVDPRVLLAISSLETGGTFSPTARAPTGTAFGMFQMIGPTAKKYGVYGSTDPELQARAGAQWTRDNMDRLEANGIQATPTAVYAMHFLGPSGGVAIMGADPNRSFLEAYAAVAGSNGAASAVANNPLFFPGGKDRTVGEVVAAMQAHIGKHLQNVSGSFSTDVNVDSTPGSLTVGGTTYSSLSQADAYPAYLDARAASAKQEAALRHANAKEQRASRTVELGTINPHDAHDRRLINKEWAASGIQDKLLSSDKSEAANAYIEVDQRAGQMGFMPKPATDALVGLLSDTRNPVSQVAGFESLARVYARNPVSGMRLSGVPEEVRKKIETYTSLRTMYGLSKQEAVAQTNITFSADSKDVIRTLKAEDVTRLIKQRTFSEIESAMGMGRSWLDFGADNTSSAPRISAMQTAMTADYRDRFKFHLNEVGEASAARALALQDIDRAFGPTYVLNDAGPGNTPRPMQMRYPPEGVYPPGPDGTHGYITDQLVEHVQGFVKARAAKAASAGASPLSLLMLGKIPKIGDIVIEGTRSTGNDLMAGSPPRYAVHYRDHDGVWQAMPGPWNPDPTRGLGDRGAVESVPAFLAAPSGAVPAVKKKVDVGAARKARETGREENFQRYKAFLLTPPSME